MIRTYSELCQLQTLEERFKYLALHGKVGDETFGSERWLNQEFYRSREWREARSEVRAREYGFDLGVRDWPIKGDPYVHHMNPLTVEDIENGTDNLFNPEYLICASLSTHNEIHFGDGKRLPQPFVERRPGDTALWAPNTRI